MFVLNSDRFSFKLTSPPAANIVVEYIDINTPIKIVVESLFIKFLHSQFKSIPINRLDGLSFEAKFFYYHSEKRFCL